MATQPVKVPDIGDFDSVEIIEVLISAGDTVEAEQPLLTLESDKATLEVPAPHAGTIAEVKVQEGDKVSEGDVIADMTLADDAGDDEATADESNGRGAEAGEASSASSKSLDDAGESESQPIKVPDIGDFDSVEVIEVLVGKGDEVEAEQALITLESDKATLEVPAPAAGRIVEMSVTEGATVSEGDVIGRMELADGGASGPKQKTGDSKQDKSDQSQEKQTVAEKPASQNKAPSQSQTAPASGDSSKLEKVDEAAFTTAHASPSVRRFARQLGADLGRIQGSGRKGRILEEDIQNYVKRSLETVQGDRASGDRASGGGGGLPAQPDTDFSQFGDTETVELSRIRKRSAQAVHKNWLLIPHVTQFESADITEMEQFRQANKEQAKADGVKLTPLAFLLKASAAALKAFPDLNSSLTADCEHLVHKHYVNIAVAVDTPNGLLMPVIKDVDQKGIYAIARDLDDVSSRAREGKIKSDDMQGACFSISSLGGVGGQAFTPIVNSPEVGILGVSKHSWQPVWQGGEFVPRLLLPLSFSYDHRVIDGAEAARITNFISRSLGDLRTLLL